MHFKFKFNTNFVLFFSSAEDGNCLFSSTSIILVGDSSLCPLLRAMTCLELSLNHEFYLDHPVFNNIFENKQLFKSKESVLSFFLSNKTYENDSNSFHNCIQEEAINMCQNYKFSSFLCVLGLSTVVNSSISIVYPDFDDPHYKVALGHTIQPRQYYQSSSGCCNAINILFCNLNYGGSKFKGNHFVPLLKKDFKNKVNKHKQGPGSTANTSSCSKRSKTSAFESLSFATPKLYNYFTPLKKTTNVNTSGFMSVTKTTATISTINSSSFTSTVSTSTIVSSKSSLLLPVLPSSYESSSPPPPPPFPQQTPLKLKNLFFLLLYRLLFLLLLLLLIFLHLCKRYQSMIFLLIMKDL